MKDIIADSFYIIIKIFRFVGLYHDGKQPKILKLWRNLLYFSCVLVTVLSYVNFVLEKNIDMMDLSQLVVFSVEATAHCLKVFLFMKNESKIKRCINYFSSAQFAPTSQQERRILDDCVCLCQRSVKIFVGALTLTGIYWDILPFFLPEATLPVKIWLPYDVTSNYLALYLTHFYVAAVVIYFATVSTSLEPLIGGLAYHAVVQLRILKYNLTYPTGINDTERNEYSTDDNKTILKQIKRCISHHNNILIFIAMFEDCFSWCIFYQTAATTFGLCFCCIGITWVSPSSMTGIMFIGTYIVVSFQLFFYCHFGTLLHEENNGLICAVYMSTWYKYDVREQKMLLTIMERSKEPITLSAGKIVSLTYQTFTSVLKTSYSLITVLNSGH